MRLSLFCLLFLLGASPYAMAASDPVEHPSAYFAAHAKDSVHWRKWGPEVLKQAKSQSKLILVSSGYFACRWDSVMRAESFGNRQIAKFIDTHFIPVLVDRELSPVLDGYLFDFVKRTRGAAGWPLNVVLTPQGFPLVGTVYLPPAEFMTWLQRLESRWKKAAPELERVAKGADRLLAERSDTGSSQTVSGLAAGLRHGLLAAAFARADELVGGFGDQGKFPSAPQLDALLNIYADKSDPRLGTFLRLTLDQMAGQGLRDHLGGGFFRYTTDPTWQEPCFEKMLFVNAQLASLYLKAARVFEEPHYRRVGLETVDFMLHELAQPDGGFISGLSGGDGDYYLWDRATLQSLLDDKAFRLAGAFWGLGAETSPWSAGNLPLPRAPMTSVADSLGIDAEDIRNQLQNVRQKLYAARAKRELPHDTVRVAAWNGLALSALAAAVESSPEPRYRQAGERLYGYLTGVLWRDGGLARVRDRQGRTVVDGTLEDYAYVAGGLMDWAKANNKDSGEIVGSLVRTAWRRFYGADGWRPAEEAALITPARALLPDGAAPSPSAVLSAVSLRLVGSEPKGAPRAATRVPAAVLDHPFRFASYLRVLDEATRLAAANGAKKARP